MSIRTRNLWLCGILLVTACSRAPAVPLLDELEDAAAGEGRPQWPNPPLEARVTFLGTIGEERGFEARPPWWRRLASLVFARPSLEFVRPGAVCVHESKLVVTDPGAGRVHLLDLYARDWSAIVETSEGVLRSPVGVACLPDGRLVVSDSMLHALWIYDPKGRPLGRFTNTKLHRPTGLVYDATHERVWVVETLEHRVLAFDLEGREVIRVGGRGVESGRFNYPTMIASDPEGGAWLTDSLNFRLQHIDARGRPGVHFGVAGDRPGSFARPRGLAVDPDGRILVVDALFDAVQIFDAQGRLLLVFGGRGSGSGEFWLPADIALDGQGHAFVVDSYNRRVQVFAYRPPARF